MRTGCGGGERARESLQRDLSVSSPLGTRKAQLMRPILTMLRPRSLSSDVLSRVLVRVSVSDDRESIIDLPKVEPLVLPTLADLPAPGCWKLVRSRTRSWNDWVSKVYRISLERKSVRTMSGAELGKGSAHLKLLRLRERG